MAGMLSAFLLLALFSRPGDRASIAPGSPATRFDAGLPDRVRKVIERSFPLAHARLEGLPACRALFARLSAEGGAHLDGTSYDAATPEEQRRYCRGTVHAFTRVGDSRVTLCPGFARLTDGQAALILIHEALHSAGQTEYPSDPAAPDAAGLTRMVMQGCHLF